MNGPPSRPESVRRALALTGIAVLWAGFVLLRLPPGTTERWLYAIAGFVLFVDAFDLLVRLWVRHTQTASGVGRAPESTSVPLASADLSAYRKRLHLRPYAILVSVYEIEEQIDEVVEALAPYRQHVWIIDDGSRDETVRHLLRLGFRCERGIVNRNKPGAIRTLLSRLPATVESIVVLDPDTAILDSARSDLRDLEDVLFDFQRRGSGALCPRIHIKPDGWLADFQALEYWMAFSIGRKSLAAHTLTSGIAVYRREVLEGLLERHSLSVYGEDLENALRLLIDGEEVYYDGRLVVETEAKRTWRGWFSQRVGWAFGLVRPYADLWRPLLRRCRTEPLLAYHYLLYMGVFGILLHPVKLATLAVLVASFANTLDGALGADWIPDVTVTEPWLFAIVYAKYTLLALVVWWTGVGRRDRLRLLPVVPLYFFYALAQLVPFTIGFSNWLSLRFWGRRIYRDHYQTEASLVSELRQVGWRSAAR